MAHQALQHLERNTRIQHVHGVRVAERVWCHRYGERHAVGGSCFYCFVQPSPHRPVGDFPDTRLLHFTVLLVASLQWNFQRGHHGLQLRDVLRIRQRHQAVCRAAGREPACGSRGLLCPLLERGQLRERVGRCQRKIPLVSASASLIRAPVFHSVASNILRCRSGT